MSFQSIMVLYGEYFTSLADQSTLIKATSLCPPPPWMLGFRQTNSEGLLGLSSVVVSRDQLTRKTDKAAPPTWLFGSLRPGRSRPCGHAAYVYLCVID